ncbi:hypothetical protein FRB94_007507 [Tulasnella sp. JGI-2019a]|nr:hypothetical protein FRB93_007139 [Tulasnella sp. JGI-2019a]KAG8997676.1 hypothetical protein FRB94_007507 [Tulasnella sp. JGI-2019a]KAG9029165.1 hypothetical protein FRB95_005623 [Tulasnella sp. JGI-2019a]
MSAPTSQITIAIAGATGNLGALITKAFLNLHPESVGRVLILTRNLDGEKAKVLEGLGARLVKLDGPIQAGALKGVDVLVNSLSGGNVPAETSDSLVKEAVASGVKVYFPSEFGMDHRNGPQNHVWFHEKARHVAAARNIAQGHLQVIQLYIGMFTEVIFGPFFGLDTKSGVYTSLGSGTADKEVSITSTADIAAAVARLAIIAVADPTSVPDQVRITGDNRSFNELADIVGSEVGKKITVVEEPVAQTSDQPDGEDLGALARLLRLNFADGAVDFSKNDNELVNPGQKFWKWKTVRDHARDVIAKQ